MVPEKIREMMCPTPFVLLLPESQIMGEKTHAYKL
jgi:hypothetical protein